VKESVNNISNNTNSCSGSNNNIIEDNKSLEQKRQETIRLLD
jgi:hypothetical protein